MCMLLCIYTGTTCVYAKSTKKATIIITNQSVKLGKETTVEIKVVSSVKMSSVFLHLQYDANVLEYREGAYGGGNGMLTLMATGDNKEYTFNITFYGKKAGASNITILQQEGDAVCPSSTSYNEIMDIKADMGKVTVKSSQNLSGNANLSRLELYAVNAKGESEEVVLSPSFSPDITQYQVVVGRDVNQFVVSAGTEQENAQIISTTGMSLIASSSFGVITVQAENGDQKNYYIYYSRTEQENTQVKTEGTIPGEITGESVKIKLGKQVLYTKESLKDVTVPEGFEIVSYTYKKKKVVAIQGLSKEITAFYLAKKDGTKGAFYIYDTEKKDFYRMNNILFGENLYTVIRVEEGTKIPSGYDKSTIKVNGISTDCYTTGDKSMYCLIYAMNGNGDKNFYRYDKTENSMQRVQMQEDGEEYLLSGQEQIANLTEKIQILEKKNRNEKKKSTLLFWGIWGLIAIVAFMIVLFVVKLKKQSKYQFNVNVKEDAKQAKKKQQPKVKPKNFMSKK